MDRVVNGADSIFEVKLLVPLTQDATSVVENEAAQITHKPSGLEKK